MMCDTRSPTAADYAMKAAGQAEAEANDLRAEVKRLREQCNVLSDLLGNALGHCPPSYRDPIIMKLKERKVP